MPAICVTVMEGPRCLINGRAVRVDESRMLESLLTEVCGMSNIYHVERVQSACTAESRDRFHAVLSESLVRSLSLSNAANNVHTLHVSAGNPRPLLRRYSIRSLIR